MVTLPPNFLCSPRASLSRLMILYVAPGLIGMPQKRAANNAHRSDTVIDWHLAAGSFGAPHEPQMAALSGHRAMSDLNPERTPKRMSANAPELRVHALVQSGARVTHWRSR
jgi:hypothetical protein